MARAGVMMDQLHVTVYLRRGLPENVYAGVRRTLRSKRFAADLHRGVREVFRKYPALKQTRFTITS